MGVWAGRREGPVLRLSGAIIFGTIQKSRHRDCVGNMWNGTGYWVDVHLETEE